MATVLLMLGSVMSAAIAGNRSVTLEPEPEPEPEPVETTKRNRVGNSQFWRKQMDNVKDEIIQDAPPLSNRKPPPPPTGLPPPPDPALTPAPAPAPAPASGPGPVIPPAPAPAPAPEPMDCSGEWSEWSECTKDCDGGTQFRTWTTLQNPVHGGAACPEPTETRVCNTNECSRFLNGYKNVHTDQGDSGIGKQCGGSPIYSSLKWELVNSDEEKVKATSFDDPYYHKYQRRAAFKCNEDQNCGNITVTKEGKYETFHPSQCINTIANSDAVTWKKVDNTVATKDLPNYSEVSPQEINGYTAITTEGEPRQKFSWRVNGKRETDIRCDSSQRVKYGKDMKKQGPEVEFDSPEYQKYVENAISRCEMEHDCNFVSVKKNGYSQMFKACSDLRKYGSRNYKTYKRGDTLPFRPEPPEEIENHEASFMGYKPVSYYKKCNNHSKALTNEYIREDGEGKVEWDDYFSYKYQELLKRGIEICNKDPMCQYLELDHKNAIVRTFKKDDCKHPQAVHDTWKHKIWEKTDWKDPNIHEPIFGYSQYGGHNQTCEGDFENRTWIKDGSVGDGDQALSTFKADRTMDDVYKKYLEKGARICNEDPNCKYVTVLGNGYYRTFSSEACENKPLDTYGNLMKTWKKEDSSVAGTPEPEPGERKHEPIFGYSQHGGHNQTCASTDPPKQTGWIKDGSVGDGDQALSTFKADGTMDDVYKKYLEKGARICNDDPNCKYVTVLGNGYYRTFSSEVCEDKPLDIYGDLMKTWKKEDSSVVGTTPEPEVPEPEVPEPEIDPKAPSDVSPDPPIVKYGYKQFGPENRFCKWWDGNIITTMGFSNPQETVNKSVNDDSLLKESIHKCNDNPECNFVSVGAPNGLDGEKTYTLFKDCQKHLDIHIPTNGPWRKDDANFIGGTPPPDPPPFSCGGNPNQLIRFDKLNDGNCDCSRSFDDEGLTDEGVAKGSCRPKQLAKILNSSEIRGIQKVKPMENGAIDTGKGNYVTGRDGQLEWQTVKYHDYKTVPGARFLKDKSAYQFTNMEPFNQGSRPYIIDEKKSGWARKVFDNRSFSECKNTRPWNFTKVGFTWIWDGEPFLYDLRLFDDDPFDPNNGSHFRKTKDNGQCIIYGDNTGEATDKKCVNDHNLHSDCYTVDKSKYGATYWSFDTDHSSGEYPTVWDSNSGELVKRKTDLAHREWKKPKYWQGRNPNYKDSTEA